MNTCSHIPDAPKVEPCEDHPFPKGTAAHPSCTTHSRMRQKSTRFFFLLPHVLLHRHFEKRWIFVCPLYPIYQNFIIHPHQGTMPISTAVRVSHTPTCCSHITLLVLLPGTGKKKALQNSYLVPRKHRTELQPLTSSSHIIEYTTETPCEHEVLSNKSDHLFGGPSLLELG